MVDDYSKLEEIKLSAAEHQEIVVELEDTFQEITEEKENAFISSLPQKTREGFQKIINDAAEHGLRTALKVMTVAVVIMLLLSLLLPATKPATEMQEEA
jgi:serine/threonine protein phosphatase PrpC